MVSPIIDILVYQHKMTRIHTVDRKCNKDIWLHTAADNILPLEYLQSAFSNAVGLQYVDPIDDKLVL